METQEAMTHILSMLNFVKKGTLSLHLPGNEWERWNKSPQALGKHKYMSSLNSQQKEKSQTLVCTPDNPE